MADEQQKQTETPAQESESGAQAEPVLEPGAESVEIPAEEAVDSAALQQELEQAQAEIADLQKQLSELQPRAQAERRERREGGRHQRLARCQRVDWERRAQA